jgi:hypothetical protein
MIFVLTNLGLFLLTAWHVVIADTGNDYGPSSHWSGIQVILIPVGIFLGGPL